jgi:hypothetical protein
MAGPQSFIDNLKNLQLVLSVALEYVEQNRDQFTKNASSDQVRQSDAAIREIRIFAQQLEREFSELEQERDKQKW